MTYFLESRGHKQKDRMGGIRMSWTLHHTESPLHLPLCLKCLILMQTACKCNPWFPSELTISPLLPLKGCRSPRSAVPIWVNDSTTSTYSRYRSSTSLSTLFVSAVKLFLYSSPWFCFMDTRLTLNQRIHWPWTRRFILFFTGDDSFPLFHISSNTFSLLSTSSHTCFCRGHMKKNHIIDIMTSPVKPIQIMHFLNSKMVKCSSVYTRIALFYTKLSKSLFWLELECNVRASKVKQKWSFSRHYVRRL